MFCPLPRRLAEIALLLVGLCVIARTPTVVAQDDYEQEPIGYFTQDLRDPVSQLQEALDTGKASLEFDADHGYLASVLRALEIPTSSQMLVFSKTSFQLTKISPRRPRAVYFNDHTYVGWVQGGDVVEISTVDPELGAVFYTLLQEGTDSPRFVRDRGQCLSCHASSRTQGVPGHLVRSVYTSPSGQPHFGAGTFTTDDRSPFEERWGGWYVSGTHGDLRHMGNVLARDRDNPEDIDREAGANVTDLSELVDTSPYLEPTSDLIALMVLEHQSQMHNALTAATYTARRAAHQDRIINEALDRPLDFESESTQRRLDRAADNVVAHLLYRDEFALTSPVAGISSFAQDFSGKGPTDSHGRSLRDFCLHDRMFRYPCSYLIYSPTFDALPDAVRRRVSEKLLTILTRETSNDDYSYLSLEDRSAIFQILRETKPNLFPGT